MNIRSLMFRYARFVMRRWAIIVPLLLIEHIANRQVAKTHNLREIDRRDAVVKFRQAVFMAFYVRDTYRIINWFRR